MRLDHGGGGSTATRAFGAKVLLYWALPEGVCVNNKEPSQPPHFLFSVGNGIPTGKLSPGTHRLAYGKFSGEYGVMHSRHIAVIPSILYPAEEHVCSRVSGSNIADTGGILHHTLPLIPRDKG